MEPRRPERATSAAKPPEVLGGATAIDLVLLPEIPAKLGHIVQPKWPAQLFPRSLLEERRRLQQVARYEKAILRDYINATIGFEELSRLTKRPSKSLMRMLGPKGNPQARNLFEVIAHLQRFEGLHFELSLKAAS